MPVESLRAQDATLWCAQPQDAPLRIGAVCLFEADPLLGDVGFDIARHLRCAALPRPGSEAQLREFVARLIEVPLDPSRPLWEIWIVEGIAKTGSQRSPRSATSWSTAAVELSGVETVTTQSRRC
jgi:hypothetical protein